MSCKVSDLCDCFDFPEAEALAQRIIDKRDTHAAVHRATRAVADRLEAERLQRIETRNAGRLVCTSGDDPFSACTRPAVDRFVVGLRCTKHAPDVVTPSCTKPLRCYRSCCAGSLADTETARAEVAQQTLAELNALKHEIVRLSRGPAFTLAELAEYLPPAKSPGRLDAERRVLGVLDVAISKGIVRRVGDRRWKGGAAPAATVEREAERENRYR